MTDEPSRVANAVAALVLTGSLLVPYVAQGMGFVVDGIPVLALKTIFRLVPGDEPSASANRIALPRLRVRATALLPMFKVPAWPIWGFAFRLPIWIEESPLRSVIAPVPSVFWVTAVPLVAVVIFSVPPPKIIWGPAVVAFGARRSTFCAAFEPKPVNSSV